MQSRGYIREQSDCWREGKVIDMKEKVNGGMETTLPEEVAPKMKALLAEYNNKNENLFKCQIRVFPQKQMHNIVQYN